MAKPLRILNLFTIMDRGGAETMVMNYYRNIDKAKVQFDFLVHRPEKGSYEEEIQAMGGRIYRMLPIYPQNFAKYKRMLKEFFNEHKEYAIIHSHMSELGYFAFKEAERQGMPFRICHAHSKPNGFDKKLIVRNYFKKRMMGHITHQFTCGMEAGEWLYGKKHKKEFIVMNNAIEATAFNYDESTEKRVRQQLGIEGKQVIGHVGRFTREKNHHFIIDVFHEIHKDNAESVLLLAGKGVLEESIKQKVFDLGLSHAVKFLGVREDINEIMQSFDLFLFPSLYEGMPLAVVEAQAAGLRVFISDKVSKECILTESVNVLPLSYSAKEWANELQKQSLNGLQKKKKIEEIKAVNYDIKENAEWLQRFYRTLAASE